MGIKRDLNRLDQWFAVIKRLRATTGASHKEVEEFLQRKGYWPFFRRSNFVLFCNDPFVKLWTQRPHIFIN